jgi:hypothetical protein
MDGYDDDAHEETEGSELAASRSEVFTAAPHKSAEHVFLDNFFNPFFAKLVGVGAVAQLGDELFRDLGFSDEDFAKLCAAVEEAYPGTPLRARDGLTVGDVMAVLAPPKATPKPETQFNASGAVCRSALCLLAHCFGDLGAVTKGVTAASKGNDVAANVGVDNRAPIKLPPGRPAMVARLSTGGGSESDSSGSHPHDKSISFLRFNAPTFFGFASVLVEALKGVVFFEQTTTCAPRKQAQ